MMVWTKDNVVDRGPCMDCPVQLGKGMLVASVGRDFHCKGMRMGWSCCRT
jgi:hypothetical protein